MDRVQRDKMIETLEGLHNLKEWKRYIQNLIQYNDRAVYSALSVLYGMQEEDEKRDNKSVYENGRGFNRVDADFLGRMAKRASAGMDLTQSELQACRWSLMKYWRQLTDRSKENLERLKRERELEVVQPQIPGLED